MTTKMFHTGDLNSGIALAIQQQKLVACFISQPDNAQSQLWEEEWLATPQADDRSLSEVINEKVVLLKIEYGSKEAGFLGAFCQIESAPMLVVIDKGRVLERIEADVDFEEWLGRVLIVCDVKEEEEESMQAEQQVARPSAPEPSTTSAQQSAPSSSTPTSLFPDRAARMEAEKRQKDAAEKAARLARSEARRQEAEDAYNHHRGDKGKQPAATAEQNEKQRSRDAWIYEQKQRKDQAKKDRERILAQIEADKAERKARAQLSKQGDTVSGATSSPLSESRMAADRRTAGAGGTCSLLIRLFDGSSLRTRFPASTATLAKDVRSYIKEQAPQGSGGADIPYTFRQILAPQPSRSIEVSEEHASLADLGLVPNATLVLVPVADYSTAYSAGSSGVMGWAAAAYNSLPNLSYFLPSFSRLYMGGTGDEGEGSNVEGARMAGADDAMAEGESGVRVRTLADQRERNQDRQTEFYNGNSSAFQGRKDDDEEKR